MWNWEVCHITATNDEWFITIGEMPFAQNNGFLINVTCPDAAKDKAFALHDYTLY